MLTLARHPHLWLGRGRKRRVWLLGVTGLVLVVFISPAGATFDKESGGPRQGPGAPGVHSSPYLDADRDRMYDELETEMARRGRDERLPVIVVFTHPVTENDLRELRARHGNFALKARWGMIPAFAARLTNAQIEGMARRSDVVQIEPDAEVRVSMETARQWYGVDKAVSDFGLTGDGDGLTTFSAEDVVICVVDTGIDASHVDLDDRQVIGWKDFVHGSKAPYDDHGHGTHVAGIAVGQGSADRAHRGVAPGSALVGVKVLNSLGLGFRSDVISGVEFCGESNGVRIMNLSLGSSSSSDGTDSLSLSMNAAFNAGILPVVAGGNSGPAAYTTGSPAAAAHALTVCSLADVGERGFFVSSFSSRGPTADGRVKPDVCAPGHNVTAPAAETGNRYATYSGTSMASPFVSGVAALMLDANARLDPKALASAIMSTAEEWLSADDDIDTGAGRLQAYEAVKAARGGGLEGEGPAVPGHHRTDEQRLSGTRATDQWDFKVTSTSYPISLTLVVPNASSSKDFDLYLYDAAGNRLGRSISTTRQETLTFQPSTTGSYRVTVVSYRGSGNYYFDLSYGGAAPVRTADG